MKTKHYPLSLVSAMNYPVSTNIQQNIPIILDMIEKLKPLVEGKKEVCLWCRGSSGSIISGIIATHIDKVKIIHLKKEGEDSHSGSISGCPSGKRGVINIIVDDFMSSGKTLNTIYQTMKDNKYKVHGLCISGTVWTNPLKFKPDFIICGYINDTLV